MSNLTHYYTSIYLVNKLPKMCFDEIWPGHSFVRFNSKEIKIIHCILDGDQDNKKKKQQHINIAANSVWTLLLLFLWIKFITANTTMMCTKTFVLYKSNWNHYFPHYIKWHHKNHVTKQIKMNGLKMRNT